MLLLDTAIAANAAVVASGAARALVRRLLLLLSYLTMMRSRWRLLSMRKTRLKLVFSPMLLLVAP